MNPESRNPDLLEESGSRNLIGMLGNAGRHGEQHNMRIGLIRCVPSGEQTAQGLFRLCSECQRISQLNGNCLSLYINEVACEYETLNDIKQGAKCRRLPEICSQRFP